MNRQKLIVVLLIVAIALSALTLFVGLSSEAGDYVPADSAQEETTQGGEVSFTVVTDDGGNNG